MGPHKILHSMNLICQSSDKYENISGAIKKILYIFFRFVAQKLDCEEQWFFLCLCSDWEIVKTSFLRLKALYF